MYRLGILDTGRNVVDLAPRPEKVPGHYRKVSRSSRPAHAAQKTGESWMKAYRIYSGRKQDALELIEHTVSNPTAREVRVRVRAVSLNYRDLMIAWGQYPIASDPRPKWARLGSDSQSASCPLSPWKRTPLRARVTSASGHNRT